MHNLRVKLSALAFVASLSMVMIVSAADPAPTAAAPALTPATDPCGPYPKLYKDTVWNWMKSNLVDPDSAKVEWQGDPKCTDIGKNGQHEYGYLVNFTVNSRNRFGAYTGKQQHGVLIRNGEVVKGIGFGY